VPTSRRVPAIAYRALGLAFAAALMLALTPGSAVAGSPCPSGAWSVSGDDPGCAPADLGFYAVGPGATSETPCPAGTYDPIGDSVSQSDCLLDSPGDYSSPGAALPIPCAPGTYGPASGLGVCDSADPGYFVANAESTTELPCLAGSFSPGGATSIGCAPAPPGYYAPAAAAAAIECAGGTFAPANSASCQDDSPGTYSAAGAGTATLCAPGSYAPNAQSSACTAADAGFFVGTSDAIAELPCPAGYYSAGPGATECTAANAGSYVAAAQASAQTTCPAGSYSSATAATACTPAPAGSYAAKGASAATVCPSGSQTTSAGESACTPIPTQASGGAGGGGDRGGAPVLKVEKVVKLAHGGVRLVLSASVAGAFSASATTAAVKQRSSSGRYGSVTVAGSGASATITIRPTKAATRLLAHSASLRISVAVTFTSHGGGSPVTRTVVVTLRGSKH
jgi:hypothetical protein